jgi:hypothetical protein
MVIHLPGQLESAHGWGLPEFRINACFTLDLIRQKWMLIICDCYSENATFNVGVR